LRPPGGRLRGSMRVSGTVTDNSDSSSPRRQSSTAEATATALAPGLLRDLRDQLYTLARRYRPQTINEPPAFIGVSGFLLRKVGGFIGRFTAELQNASDGTREWIEPSLGDIHRALEAVARRRRHAEKKLSAGDGATFPDEPPPWWIPEDICKVATYRKWERIAVLVPALSELREILHDLKTAERTNRPARNRPRMSLPRRAPQPPPRREAPRREPRVRRRTGGGHRNRRTTRAARVASAPIVAAAEPAIAAASEVLVLPDPAATHPDDAPQPQGLPGPRSRLRHLSPVGGAQ
jgi:hypothetical protein